MRKYYFKKKKKGKICFLFKHKWLNFTSRQKKKEYKFVERVLRNNKLNYFKITIIFSIIFQSKTLKYIIFSQFLINTKLIIFI